jgi:iron complex outermembrane receptor protein
MTERVSLVGNYAYIDAKVIADDGVNRLNPFGNLDPTVYGPPSGLYGNHLQNVPRHSGKVFAIYNFGENGLGWRVGLGVTASTQAWGDPQNTFIIPGWARLDGMASYATMIEAHKLTAQLNLKNINNAQYYSGPDSFVYTQNAQQTAFPMAPFTATGTVRFEW